MLPILWGQRSRPTGLWRPGPSARPDPDTWRVCRVASHHLLYRPCTLALAMWQELPLRVPERTAGERCVLWLPSHHTGGAAHSQAHAGAGERRESNPSSRSTAPAEQTRPRPPGGHYTAHQRRPIRARFEAEKAEAPRGSGKTFSFL